MTAIQVSEDQMVSMFRRAADAIVNESSLKDEVESLRTQANVLDSKVLRLDNDKSALNDYVGELQRQLTEAKNTINSLQYEQGLSGARITKLEDENETLKTLLNETEQARDHHKEVSEIHFKSYVETLDKYEEAREKLRAIQSALGLPKIEPAIEPVQAAPEVAAESTFPVGSQQPSGNVEVPSESWRSSDPYRSTDEHPEVEATQVPQQQSDPVPATPDQTSPGYRPLDWMNV